MKRFFSFLVLIFFLSQISFSQLIEYVDFADYGGTNLANGWQEAQGEGQPTFSESSWYASNILFGSNHAAISITSNYHREWIVSPEFTATENTVLNFYAAQTLFHDDPGQGYFSFDDSVAVMISVDGGNYEPAGLTFNMSNQLTNELSFQELDLSQFAGSTLNIAFYATDGNIENSVAAFHIDDIVIKNAMPVDAEILSINSPVENECYGAPHPIVVELRNSGNAQITTIPVRIRIRGAAEQNIFSVYNQVLEPGETAIFEAGTFDFTNYGDYFISVTTECVSDEIMYNNSKTTLIHNPISKNLPSRLLDFVPFYSENLSIVYPGWYEARGDGVPQVRKDVDWQADEIDNQRTASVYFYAVGTEDWIISPKFIIESNTVLQFKAAYESETYSQMGSDDKLAIMISTDCGETWQETDNIDQSSDLDATLQNFTFDLSAYSGQEAIIGIYATTGDVLDDEAYILHIDDVIIRNQFAEDAGVVQILAPTSSCSFSSDETISVKVKNFGTSSISNFDISYKLNDGSIITETVSQTLNSNDEITFDYTQTADFSTQSSNYLEVWTSLTNDEFTGNDTISKNINLSGFDLSSDGAFVMGFENNEPMTNWFVEDANNDGLEWNLNEEAQYSHSGTNSYQYLSNNSSATSDDWLFTPCFNLQAGVNYQITFFYKNRATAFPEKLELMSGGEQSSAQMTETIVDLGLIDNYDFLESTTTYSVTSSGEYYFGWHAYGDADQFGLYIDDIEITQIFDTDLKITAVNVQRNKDGNCSLLNSSEIYVNVENIGTTTVTDIPIGYSVDGVTPEVETFTQTLNPGEDYTFTVTQNVDVTPNEEHNIAVWTENSSDLNTTNDTIVLDNILISDFSTSFEPSEIIGNWTVESLQGSPQWELTDDNTTARTGDYTYSIRTDTETNDDWLFSECYELEAGVCYNLKFYYRSRYSYENLTVYLGTNNTNTAMTDLIFEDPEFYSNEYIEANIPLTVETTGAYYIGWHTSGSTSGKYFIYIDDVSLNKNQNSPVINSIDANVFDREVLFSADVENPGEILWDFGDGNTSEELNPTHIYENPGTYSVAFQTSDACNTIEETSEVVIDCTLPVADFDYSVNETEVTFTTDAVADYYDWFFDDGNVSNEQNPTHNYTVSTTTVFDVSLSLYNSCGAAQITQPIEIVTSINELDAGIKIYPNPVKENLFIEIDNNNSVDITIYDISGKIVEKINSSNNKIEYNTSVIKPGVYLIKFETENKIYYDKFTRE